ncbi:hypothetical protein Cantr_02508 [Candida viswanathii]|uniref:Uncharacterized protein n=1 Tax=Candida viswanathii TaxID=5486 RepID=A0A367YNF3_9ASCO|nr:hypothetical protein Cantr_02508 [Candida viswanathii]
MGHKKHSSRKSKHAIGGSGSGTHSTSNTTTASNTNLSSPEPPSLEVATKNSGLTHAGPTPGAAQTTSPADVNRYLYEFISSEEFHNCYPIVAFQSSVLLTCVELLEKQKETGENVKIPMRELLVNAEKRIRDWEERAGKQL